MLQLSVKTCLALLWGIAALFSEGSLSASMVETSSIHPNLDPHATGSPASAARDETETFHATHKPAEVDVSATADHTAAPREEAEHSSDASKENATASVAGNASGPPSLHVSTIVTTTAADARPSRHMPISQTESHQQSSSSSATNSAAPLTTKTISLSSPGDPPQTPVSTQEHSAPSATSTSALTMNPTSEATPPLLTTSENSTGGAELSSTPQPFSATTHISRSAFTDTGESSSTTEPHIISSSTSSTTEPPIISSSTSSTTEPPIISSSTSSTTEPPIISSSTSSTTEPPIISSSTGSTTEPPIISSSTSSTTEPPIISSSTSSTTEPPIISSSTDSANNTNSSSPGGGLVYHVSKKVPVQTTESTATTLRPSESPPTEVQPCSTRLIVKQCLIAISSLAGLATIFMVSTIILCTKLSARKYKVRKPQQGTEMMCISSLLPERNHNYSRQRNPLTNGILVIHGMGDSDEDGGDNLTLSSFLPENDRYV